MEKEKKMGAATLAKKTGISVSYASRLLRGERKPSVNTLLRISRGLGIDLNETFRVLGVRDGAN